MRPRADDRPRGADPSPHDAPGRSGLGIRAREHACWNASCGSANTRVEALPFSQDQVELRRKRAETILMNLALSVLHAASYRAKDAPIATPDVRLARRVLYPYLRDETNLRSYWAAAAAPRDHAWDSCHRPHEAIVATLLKRGLAVDAELR